MPKVTLTLDVLQLVKMAARLAVMSEILDSMIEEMSDMTGLPLATLIDEMRVTPDGKEVPHGS
jgi:hypothetical protein